MFRKKLSSSNLKTRIVYFSIIFLITFFGIAILSYFILPEGFLLNKNSLTSFNVSSNLIISAIKIFLYNMISIIFVILASIFSRKKKDNEEYLSLGYLCFIVFISINAITLGTWSFTYQTTSVSLLERIIGMFIINKNAGLVEMFGQLLITCALANKYIIMIFKNKTLFRKIKDVKWLKQDIICIIIGLVLMFVGAVIESNSILIR